MTDFASAVNDFFFKEKGVNTYGMAYMEMPIKKENYNLSRIIGNVNLTEKRFIIKSEADDIITNFISMPLP